MPDVPRQLESGVAEVPDAHSPAARVRAALECLGLKAPPLGAKGAARHLRTAGAFGPGGSKAHARPTIMEYHAAYMSGVCACVYRCLHAAAHATTQKLHGLPRTADMGAAAETMRGVAQCPPLSSSLAGARERGVCCTLHQRDSRGALFPAPPGEITPSVVVDEIIRFVEREEGAANWLCDFRPAHLRAQVSGRSGCGNTPCLTARGRLCFGGRDRARLHALLFSMSRRQRSRPSPPAPRDPTPPLAPQAAASSARWAAGAPLSVLDGVPFGVKDVIDTFAHTSGSGTAFLGDMKGPVADVALEAPCVAALRSLGALCVGKTQMQVRPAPALLHHTRQHRGRGGLAGLLQARSSRGARATGAVAAWHARPRFQLDWPHISQTQEFGLLPTGISAKLGLARNPHNLACIPGGSRWVPPRF